MAMEEPLQPTQTQESRVRRLADREGYWVVKSRRSLGPDNHGDYMLIDVCSSIARGHSVLGFRYDASLDEIEAWLRSEG